MKTCPNCGHVIYRLPASFVARLEAVDMPRRERQVLDELLRAFPRRIQNSFIAGRLWDDESEGLPEPENIVHSHISKLRTKLKAALGYDPISAKRFEGYRLVLPAESPNPPPAESPAELAPASAGGA